MEDVTLDHNMDMSGELQGPLDNHDEIEIDLDFAPHPAEDRDLDVVVDDASVAASDGAHDASHDADMIDDEFSESHTLNPEYSFHPQEQPQNIDEGEYHGDAYEEEMDEDYEEDIDAPIPGTSTLEFQGTVPEEMHHQPEPTHPQNHGSLENDTSRSPAKTPPKSIAPQTRSPKSPVEEDRERHDQPTDDVEETPNAEEVQQGSNVEQDQETHGSPQDKEQPATDYHPVEEPQESAEPKPDNGYERPRDTGTREDEADYYVEKEMDEHVNLHNIKIIYQDAEISLFPPMEDDPTETYFLEDTGLAHEPIRQVFDACRLVLNNHIDEGEELVVDIDCLNLHLSQSASQTSDVTLFQITQVYHNLCVNDGINTPGPFYLSLSSTNSFEASFKGLADAAEAGKGLSSIESWDSHEQDGLEENAASPDGENGETSGNLDDYDQGFTEASHTKPTEPEKEQPQPSYQTAEYDERRENVVAAEVSEIASERSDYAEPAAGQVEETAESATWHEQGEEHPSTNEEGVGVEENAETGKADEAIETASHDDREDDRGKGYIDFHTEASQSEQQPSVAYTETPQEKDVHARDSLVSHDAPPNYGQEPDWDDAQWENAAPQWHAQEAGEQPEGTSGAGDVSGGVEDDSEIYGGPSDVEHATDDFAETRETDIRQPEITFDETAIDASGEDTTEQLDNPAEAANGQPQDTLTAETGPRPRTPETSHSLLDVEEDIFTSPIAEKPALAPSAVDLAADPSLETEKPGAEAFDDEEYLEFSDVESGEVVPSEDGEIQLLGEKSLADGSPTSAKRPRPDDDDGVDTEENSVPELKRHRSE